MKPVPRRWLAVAAAAAIGCTPTLSQPRGEAHLDAMARAARHHHHGRMREAADAWAEAARTAERRVDRDEALYRRAKALERIGDRAGALVILDGLAGATPVSRRTVRALFDASLLRLDLGQREEGLAGMRALVEAHPGHGLARRALELVLDGFEERGDRAGALRFARRLYARARETELGDNLLMYQAAAARRAGQDDIERDILRRIVRDHPYPHGQLWDQALVRLADMAEAEGDVGEAIRFLTELVSVHEWTTPGTYTLPTMAESQLRIARLHRDRLRDPAAAVAAYRVLVEEFRFSLLRDDAMVEMSEVLLGEREADEACDILAEVLREFEVGRARRRADGLLREHCR